MKLIAITDIHGRERFDDNVRKNLSDADVILIAGDITNFGGEKEADLVLQKIYHINSKILALPGNCDQPSVNNFLILKGLNLHAEIKMIDNIAFFGLGGSSKTPFRTPQEYSESEFEEILKGFEKREARFHILLSHSPPAKTRVDRTFFGLHAGSKAVRNFIEKFQPDLVICGHIHEAKGIDTIGKTVVINPGPFPKHYALVNLEQEIEYELR